MSQMPASDRFQKVRIERMNLTPVFVPFQELVKKAMQAGAGKVGMMLPVEDEWLGGDFVICKLVADDGNVGLGEVFLWLPETGVSPAQVIEVIQAALARYVLGENPFNFQRILDRMDNNVARNEVAKGLLDLALYDLMGKISGAPVCDLIGGAKVKEISLCALVPLMNLDSMVSLAKGFCAGGFRTIRIKLGRSIEDDVRIMRSVREAVGKEVRIRVDYNQAYSPEPAVTAIRAIEKFGIEFAEQPVKAEDYPGMAYVQKNVDTPLMAHEGCFSLRDIITLVELKAIRVVGINSERPGGMTRAIQALDFARERGLSAVLHNQPLGIASAMQIHLAAAKYDALGYATELFGQVMLEDDLITRPIDYGNGRAKLPPGPGWGVDLDEGALEKYATGATLILKA